VETDYDVGGSDNEDDKDEDAKSDSLSFFLFCSTSMILMKLLICSESDNFGS